MAIKRKIAKDSERWVHLSIMISRGRSPFKKQLVSVWFDKRRDMFFRNGLKEEL